MPRSLWKSTTASPNYPALSEDIEVEIAIVGGGITGITTAYLLAQSGKKVALLESHTLGGSTTGGSTGNLYTMLDSRLHHVQSKFDKETANTVAKSRTAAVNFVEDIVIKHKLDCDFKRVPWVLYSDEGKKDKTIEKEKKTMENYGLEVEELNSLPLPFKTKLAIRVENQAQFNPAAFVRELAPHINQQNCRIFEHTPVQHIDKGSPHLLTTPKGTVKAKKVILATHIPKGVYALQTVLFPHREYAVAFTLNSGTYPEGIYWSTEATNHQSVRSYTRNGKQYLIIVGQHHKVGQAEKDKDYFGELEKNARKFFDIGSIAYKWSAQHYKSADGLPFIGESADDDIYIATGFATDGLTYGVVAAMMFNDLLNAQENPWATTYNAKRFTPLKSATSFIKENLNVLGQYLKNLPGVADADDFDKIAKGEGKVIEVNNEKWAVHREKNGRLCASSAVCTHMECIVNWNDEEKSWDCPCHGSRFSPSGEVIEGPAFSPLDKRNIISNTDVE